MNRRNSGVTVGREADLERESRERKSIVDLRQPEEICFFADSMLEQSKGNRSTWASRGRAGQQCSNSNYCITVQSLVWTEPLSQTISVQFELKFPSPN
ncbi:hypothetical protein TIFTF001_026821 [Ficus carica]|uniref:Uncharacterized protein n=1 Tax=Ficus carica TaxID=3494 RepID=A0AA88DLU9_FICCA|nr:hypothetical protein TIFTF001_026821 [Ficus carica]